jgi:hypothetical protein
MIFTPPVGESKQKPMAHKRCCDDPPVHLVGPGLGPATVDATVGPALVFVFGVKPPSIYNRSIKESLERPFLCE